MKSIYLSPDRETMVVYDDEEDIFIILEKHGESLTTDEANELRKKPSHNGRSGYDTIGRDEMLKRAARARGPKHCGNCGAEGHQITRCPKIPEDQRIKTGRAAWKTSPRTSPSSIEVEQAIKRATPLDEDDLKASIAALKLEGKNSAEISKILRIPLTTVNQYWPHSRVDEDETSMGLVTAE